MACAAKERRPVRGPRRFSVATDPRMKAVKTGVQIVTQRVKERTIHYDTIGYRWADQNDP
jgi:hypothetical protein